MADYVLKVSTEEVRAKAQQISVQRGIIADLMNEFQTKVASLENSFKSEAGTDYIMQFQNVTKNINASLDVLQKHVTNLMDVADSYDRIAGEQVKKVQGLSTENIF